MLRLSAVAALARVLYVCAASSRVSKSEAQVMAFMMLASVPLFPPAAL